MVDGRLEVQHGRIKPFYASDSSPRFMGRKERGDGGERMDESDPKVVPE